MMEQERKAHVASHGAVRGGHFNAEGKWTLNHLDDPPGEPSDEEPVEDLDEELDEDLDE